MTQSMGDGSDMAAAGAGYAAFQLVLHLTLLSLLSEAEDGLKAAVVGGTPATVLLGWSDGRPVLMAWGECSCVKP